MILSFLATVFIAAQGSNGPEVTIYNQGFALIKDRRTLNLRQGRQTVSIEDVAAQIEPDSVGFKSETEKDSFNVLEQNYQYDLISPEAILNKAVGQKIRFIRVLPNSAKEVLTGTLMSAPTAVVNPGTESGGGSTETYNGMVIKTDDGRIVLDPTGEIEVESLPEGLISKPTLLWDIESKQAGENRIELSYLTQGMTWNANYVLTLDDASTTGDLQGWVTLNNSCGVTFKDAKLKLLAGEVNRPQGRFAMNAIGGAGMAQAPAPQFQEQSLFEYHLYTLQRPTTLHDKETKQVSLLEGHGIKVEKKLIVDSMRDVGRYYPSEGEVGTGPQSPQVRLEFWNRQDNGLGMPLPEGNFKIYQRDTDGSVQMLGEDHINHTPKDEHLSLVVGRSFDVVSERKRLQFLQVSPRSVSETFEIDIRNHKASDQSVVILERHYGDWKVPKTSDPFTKPDSNSMQFVVNVPANGSKTVTYAITTQW